MNSDYDLYSVGKDGASSPPIMAKPSQDDVIRASNGSYVGLAANFCALSEGRSYTLPVAS